MFPDSERPDPDEASELLSACAALPLTERSAFLDTRCAGRPALRSKLEALLPYLHDPEFEDGDESDSETARAQRRVGSEIGGCRLVELLAMGGMGAVYRAEQESPRREVALKLLRPDGLGTDAWRRLKREALVLGRLDHPAIARVFAAGIHRDVHGATPYLIMELVEGGRTVTDWWRERELPLARRISLFATACEAIHHGHIKGVLHRDVKPGNLLVDREDRPKVIDFGIARMLEPGSDEGTAPVTAGRVIGTIAYMAPERFEGTCEADVRSDVYGLGVLLYELLTGRLPFGRADGSIAATASAIARGGAAPPSSVDRRCRGDLDAIVAKAMSIDPADRYDSASALAADLRSHLENAPIQARGVGWVRRTRKFLVRHRLAATSILAVFVALAIGLGASLRAKAKAERALILSMLAEGELTVARNDVGSTLEILARLSLLGEGYWPIQVLRRYTDDSIDSAGSLDWQPTRGRLDHDRKRMLVCGSGERSELVILGTLPARVLGRIPLPAAGMAADWGPVAADGFETVIAGLADGRILELRAADGAIVRELDRITPEEHSGAQGPIDDVALDPTSRRLAIGHSFDAVRLIGMTDGSARDLRGFSTVATPDRISVEWDGSGGMLAVAGSGGTFVVEASSGSTRKLSNRACKQAVFSPEGDRLATALRAGGVEVIDLETGVVRLICPAEWPIRGVDWSPDGKRVAIVGDSHWVITCDASTGARTTLRTDIARNSAVRWFTDDEFLAIPGGRVFSTRHPRSWLPPPVRGVGNDDRRVLRLRFVDGGRSMLHTGPDGRIEWIDPLLMTRTEISRVPVSVPSTDFAAHAQLVAVADGVEPGPLWLVRPRDGTTLRIEGEFLGPVAISPDGMRVLACGPAGEAVAVDAVSGRIEHRQDRPPSLATETFVWLDSNRVLWCLSQGQALLERDGDGGWSFRPDPTSTVKEAWGRGDGDWYWVDRSTRLMRSGPDRIGTPGAYAMYRQNGAITCVSAHPSLPLLAIGNSDGRIVVFDEAMEGCVAGFHPITRRITDLAWSPDGSMLAVADAAGGVFIAHATLLSQRWPEIERRRRAVLEADSAGESSSPSPAPETSRSGDGRDPA